MREQCKGCLYFCDTPMLIGPHCHHIKSAIVPGWWEVHPDGECPEYTDKEKWVENVTELLKNIGTQIEK